MTWPASRGMPSPRESSKLPKAWEVSNRRFDCSGPQLLGVGSLRLHLTRQAGAKAGIAPHGVHDGPGILGRRGKRWSSAGGVMEGSWEENPNCPAFQSSAFAAPAV